MQRWNVIIVFMQQVTSDDSTIDKLKSVFFLGITCNFTTVAGLVTAWILMVRNGWVHGFWQTLFAVVAFTPVFMADAINNYTLGRIRLEKQKNWEDIRITPEGRSKVAFAYMFYRAISVVATYSLAGVMLLSKGADLSLSYWFKIAFLIAFVVHFIRAGSLLKNYMGPLIPSYSGRPFARRSVMIFAAFAGLYYYIWFNSAALSNWQILGIGFIYFFINAFMQPLPSRFSLLRPQRKRFSAAMLKVDAISLDELKKLSGASAIVAATENCLKGAEYTLIDYVRMPLIELPIFQTRGSGLRAKDGKSLLFFLDSEVKPGLYRVLISATADGYFITTDFGSPQALFPESVVYTTLSRDAELSEFYAKHTEVVSGNECIEAEQPWELMERLVRLVTGYLDAESRKSVAASKKTNITRQVVKEENTGDSITAR